MFFPTEFWGRESFNGKFVIWLLSLYALTWTASGRYFPTSIWANRLTHTCVFGVIPLTPSLEGDKFVTQWKLCCQNHYLMAFFLWLTVCHRQPDTKHSTMLRANKIFPLPTTQFTARKVLRNSINCYDFAKTLMFI